MPIHIGEMQSDITVQDGETPLTPQQIEQIVEIVMQRLEEKGGAMSGQDGSRIRSSAIPRLLDES